MIIDFSGFWPVPNKRLRLCIFPGLLLVPSSAHNMMSWDWDLVSRQPYMDAASTEPRIAKDRPKCYGFRQNYDSIICFILLQCRYMSFSRNVVHNLLIFVNLEWQTVSPVCPFIVNKTLTILKAHNDKIFNKYLYLPLTNTAPSDIRNNQASSIIIKMNIISFLCKMQLFKEHIVGETGEHPWAETEMSSPGHHTWMQLHQISQTIWWVQ